MNFNGNTNITTSSSYSNSSTKKSTTTKKNTYESYDDGYDDIYMDGNCNYDRYYTDSDYANGVDDAMDEMYFTIAGCNHYFGNEFMEKGMKLKLVKETG